MQFGYNQLLMSKACLDVVADALNIITVGNVKIPAINYASGSAIESALTADTWIDIQDINLGSPFLFSIIVTGGGSFSDVVNDASETEGNYLRLQWEQDGIVILDFKVGVGKNQSVCPPAGSVITTTNTPSIPFFVKSRFRVRAYKHGTFSIAGSKLRSGEIRYIQVTPT